MTNFDLPFFSRIFENSSTIVIETANQTGEPILGVTPNASYILGHSSEFLNSQKVMFDDFLHEDDIATYLIESQQGSFDESCSEIVHSEYRIRHREGHYIWIKDRAQIIRSGATVDKIVHVITDISDEINVRHSIETSKRRLVSLLHHAGFGMWEWNVRHETIHCDENWCHLIGFKQTFESLKISRLYALIHADDLLAFKRLLEELGKGKKSKGEIVLRVRHLSGNWRYHQCHAAVNRAKPVADIGREHTSLGAPIVFMSHTDITAQKENELAAISALSARNQFFARVSHEIRTPLHGILGMLGLVKQDNISALAIDKIDKITAHSEQLLYLLNDILDLAKLNEAKLKISIELISISEVINQVHRLFSFKADEKSIAFKTSLPLRQHDMVVTDKVRLTQVLSNIVSNAIKYTHNGSVHLYTKLEDDILLLCVEDTGIGIKDTATIFDAYKQEKAGIEFGAASTGLGLEIVKKLCDLLGIEIRLSSNKNGTLFELVLSQPMPNTLTSSKALSVDTQSELSLSEMHMLVVDDSDINRQIVEEMLKMAGATCEHAVDGYEAVKAVSGERSFDVVLMDKHMPKMNGLDATREIRQNKNIKQPIIIALTADAFDIDNEQWYEYGINELLTKPFDMDLLTKTISRCVRK